MKKYNAQKNEKDKELNELAEIAHKEKLEKFIKTEGKLLQSSSSESSVKKDTTIPPSVNNMSKENKSKLPSFWIPSLVPESKIKTQMKKPVIYFY